MTRSALGVPVVRALRVDDRSAVVAILASIQSFRSDEREIALELFDLGIGVNDDAPIDPDYCWLGVQDGADLAGFACYGRTPGTHATFDLYWIAVAPQLQGRGIGSELLDRVEGAVDRLGGRLLVVETSSASEFVEARSFYIARGYALVATIRDFYRAGDDRLILTRRMGNSAPLASRIAV